MVVESLNADGSDELTVTLNPPQKKYFGCNA